MVQPEHTSGENLTEYNIGENKEDVRRSGKSEVKSLVYVALSLSIVTKCYSYSKSYN
jgi:hypothetical protein